MQAVKLCSQQYLPVFKLVCWPTQTEVVLCVLLFYFGFILLRFGRNRFQWASAARRSRHR